MKILFITTGLNTGGAEIALLKIVSGLKVSNHIEVISLRGKGDIGPKLEDLGIKVTALSLSKNPISFFKLLKLHKMIKAFNPDIVQTWMYHADLIGGIFAKLAGIKNIVWGIRNSDLSPKRVSKLTILTARACARLSKIIPSKIVSNSQQALDEHAKFGYQSEKFYLLPNGFNLSVYFKDEEKRKKIRQELSISNADKVVGMIGRFDPQKNHLGFLNCALMILEQDPNIKFVLAGEGINLENQALREAIPYYLRANFLLLGLRTDMPELLNAIDLLALPSFGEAFPNILGEAMACETPCVCTNTGDCANIIGDTAQIVPIGDMRAMANKLIDYFNLDQADFDKLGVKARSRIKENFDIDIRNNQLENLYIEICKTRF